MRYAGIKPNDIVDGEGVCVSFWTQGCPHKCLGCHNPETWDFEGGYEDEDYSLLTLILKLINKNGVQRNLSILGGEPLCQQNIKFVEVLIKKAKEQYPDIKIFLWTGYSIDKIKSKEMDTILALTDVIVDGPFVLSKRDLTLKLRGSSNQRVLYKGVDF
jgi:anaerobic ribonucleoside-triphosphate reductase activating protein